MNAVRGKLILDGTFALVLTLVTGLPLALTKTAYNHAQPYLGAFGSLLLLPLFGLADLLLMALVVGLIRAALPSLQPGRYAYVNQVPGHTQVRVWIICFALQRIVYLPLWRPIYFCFYTLRWCLLKALGGRVALAINTSSDAMILDAQMMQIGADSLLGSGVLLAGHLVEKDSLYLGRVKLGRGVQILANAQLGPGVTVGDNSIIGISNRILPNVTIGAGVRTGIDCIISSDVRIGDAAIIGNQVFLEAGVEIGDGVVIKGGTRVAKGTKIAAGTKFPAVAA